MAVDQGGSGRHSDRVPVKEQLREIFGGTTQVKVAEHLTAHGLTTTQSTVSAWLRGRMPDLDQLARIEDIYGVPRGTVLVRAGYIAGHLAEDTPVHTWEPHAPDDIVAAVRQAIADGEERSAKMNEVIAASNEATAALAEVHQDLATLMRLVREQQVKVDTIADFADRRRSALARRSGELD